MNEEKNKRTELEHSKNNSSPNLGTVCSSVPITSKKGIEETEKSQTQKGLSRLRKKAVENQECCKVSRNY